MNRKTNILVESQDEKYAYGYTPNYIMAKIDKKENIVGKEIQVILQEIDKDYVIAKEIE